MKWMLKTNLVERKQRFLNSDAPLLRRPQTLDAWSDTGYKYSYETRFYWPFLGG